ncbi:MAG: amidase [Ilumatobacter sp.]|jgi:aspartyl-tRNA(Asn)/glutamyl-tRNA(Gln) amidotransferase subunit A|uniref:amidase n=1 Tax=Ilumatobacter sp. TaxID=1967498 RepID=UPI00391B1B7B
MSDDTFQGDAVGLVEAFRAGERSPSEELAATYAAIDSSDLNAVCFTDREAAEAAARTADISLPFGGVPIGVKSLTDVAGWPADEASVPLRHLVAAHTATMVQRIRDLGGAVLAAQTTSSEFGGVNVTRTVLHGTTHNPWQHGRTPGGSSGGSAAAVAGGVLPIATGGDGGGSIRIPAGFTGLVGLKGTFGRIPLGPAAQYGNLTVSTGCMARSVRDTARWFDVTSGHDPTDPLSLPKDAPWEPMLGTHVDALRGLRVAVVPDWGGATVSPVMWELLEEAAHLLIDDVGLRRVDGVETQLPRMGAAWSISGMISIAEQLKDHWPACADDLTPEMRAGLELTAGRYGADERAKIERRRMEVNQAMARIFDPSEGVDLIITASNPDVAFDADGPLPSEFGGVKAGQGNNGLLTFPANLHGNPAISVPAGFLDGLPIGLQIIGRHFTEPLLLDLALSVERARPWPLTSRSTTTGARLA